MTHPKYEFGKPLLPALTALLDVVEPTLTVPVKTAAEMFRLPAIDLVAFVEKSSGQRLGDLLAKYAQSTDTKVQRDHLGGFYFSEKKKFLAVHDFTERPNIVVYLKHRNYGNAEQYQNALNYVAGIVQYALVAISHVPRGYAFQRDDLLAQDPSGERGVVISWSSAYGVVGDVEDFTAQVQEMLEDGGSPKRRDGTRLISEPFPIADHFNIALWLN